LLVLSGRGARSSHNAVATATMSAAEPVPIWSVTWTATASGLSDTTDDSGERTVDQRRVVMTGSAIERMDSDGEIDNSPFNLNVTDEEDIVQTFPCGDGTFDRRHTFIHITDPNRYTGGLHRDIAISAFQHPDGSWYIFFPLPPDFYVNRFFTYRFDGDGV